MKKVIGLFFIVAFSVFISGQAAWAGAKEAYKEEKAVEEAVVEKGEYIVAKGRIIPPEEIYEDSYVAAVDFQYPEPEGSFGVRFFSGNRQVSTAGQDEVIIIGIQGRRFTFEDLPVMNHTIVIDKSGSMYQKDKMNWVKESIEVYLNMIREKDFVSLVVFDDTARVVFPATQMKGEYTRKRFRDAVNSIMPGGGSDMISGLKLGYKELLSNYRKDYMNQVLFLTDGTGASEEIFELAVSFREIGINVTVIGLGEDCDLDFLSDLAGWGGGGFRFISGREKMEEIFGSDFGRMVIPAARDVDIELYCLQNLKDVRAWGYNAEIEGQWDNFEHQEGEPSVPHGIAVDLAGNLYIADNENNRIQKFDSSGNFVTQWGHMGTRKWGREGETRADKAESKFYKLRGLAAGPDGYVYVADSGNNRIQKFDSRGNYITQWGGPGSGEGEFKDPTDVAVDSKGYIYVADSGNNRIQKFDGDGNRITQWGGQGYEIGQFETPVSLATDIYSNVYVADSRNNRVQIFESDGTFISEFRTIGAGSITPAGIAVDFKGNIYIADSSSNKIQKYNMEKNYLAGWGSFGSEETAFGNLTAVATGPGGNVYAADAYHKRIQEFDGSGTIMIKQPIRFSLSTVNLGDYETIVIKANIPEQDTQGVKSIAQLKVTYTDMEGKRVEMSPIDLNIKFVDTENPIDGISNASVLRAAAMLNYAQALKGIGRLYYNGDVHGSLQRTNEIKKELINVRERLGEEIFDSELSVLEKYITKLAAESGYDEDETAMIMEDREIAPVSDDRSIDDHLKNLFEEMMLDLQAREARNVAMLGFSFPDDRQSGLLDYINKTAESYLSGLPQHRVLERERLDEIMAERGLSLSDLTDTGNAIDIGESISANYILTGSVIEMSKSVVIFCRVVNVETAVIESVGQVIVPRNEEVNGML